MSCWNGVEEERDVDDTMDVRDGVVVVGDPVALVMDVVADVVGIVIVAEAVAGGDDSIESDGATSTRTPTA